MDLNAMLKREENFFETYFESIQRLYKLVYDSDITLSLIDKKGSAGLVIYPKLSAASSKSISKRAKEFFYSEWNIRDNIVKRALLKFYLFIALNSHGMLAQYNIAVYPNNSIKRDIVVAPNNRSVRIFDYSNDKVSCIVKSGFTRKFFTNQLEFRKKTNYSFILPLIQYGVDWFVEPILHGHPLARVSDKGLYDKGMNEAIKAIGELAHDTLRKEYVNIYVEKLKKYLLCRLEEAKETKSIDITEEFCDFVCALAKPLETAIEMEIPLVTSHGDFQSGNIWVEANGKVWLYDWETVEERSIWYDPVTLLFSIRRAGGLERLWSERLNSTTMALAVVNDSNKDCSTVRSDLIARVVLLEDIKFYIDDMLELPNDWGKEIFINYWNRLNVMEINAE